jgi:hypothetical protein
MENGCKLLGEAAEYPTDQHLLFIIQLQHIVENINNRVLDIGQELNISNHAVAALLMTFKSDLEIFKERLPFNISESRRSCLPFQLPLSLTSIT